jgi:hypothetical protein
MKAKLISLIELPTHMIRHAPFGLSYGVEYECSIRNDRDLGFRVQVEGSDLWLDADLFEFTNPVRSSDETPDDIAQWYGNNHADPIAGMSNEIHMLRADRLNKTR